MSENASNMSGDPSILTGNLAAQNLDIANLPEWSLLMGEGIASSPEAAQTTIDNAAEARRTELSLKCLTYLHEGGDENYQKLTVAQGEAVRLSHEEFEELGGWFRHAMPDESSYQTMQYIMLIHDAGKNSQLVDEMGIDHQVIDHDEVLDQLLNAPEYIEQRQAILPTFSSLSEPDQRLVQNVFSVKLNFSQFLQAEVPAVALEGVPKDLDEKSKTAYIMHAVLDIAGATGHLNPDSSPVLTSSMYKSMVAARAALTDKKYIDADERYNAYLARRAEQFGINARNLPKHSAEIRLACMLRCASPEEFDDFAHALTHEVGSADQSVLFKELSRNGVTDRARLPYYGPALLRAVTEKSNLPTALKYFALTMYRAVMADYDNFGVDAEHGMVTVDLGDLTKYINQTGEEPLPRFKRIGNKLVSVVQED